MIVLVPMLSFARVLLAVACMCHLAGCAHSWTDANGTRHVLGFVRMEIPSGPPETSNGQFTRISSIGLSLFQAGRESGLALGYNSMDTAWIGGSACFSIQDLRGNFALERSTSTK